MKSKAFISLILALLMLFTLTTPALAAKASLRDNLTPSDETTNASGKYECYINPFMFSFTITAMKLTPDTEYYVGYIINNPGELDFGYMYGTPETDSRGKLTWTTPPNLNAYFDSNDSFVVYIDIDNEPPYDFYSDKLVLFP